MQPARPLCSSDGFQVASVPSHVCRAGRSRASAEPWRSAAVCGVEPAAERRMTSEEGSVHLSSQGGGGSCRSKHDRIDGRSAYIALQECLRRNSPTPKSPSTSVAGNAGSGHNGPRLPGSFTCKRPAIRDCWNASAKIPRHRECRAAVWLLCRARQHVRWVQSERCRTGS